MADDFKKAEPSRWESGVPGHIPTFSSHKLRRMAAEGMGEVAAHVMEVQRLFRVEPENRTGEMPRHVVSLEDVTRGLGLDSADEQRIQQLVSNTNAHFDQTTQTQKLMAARGRLLSVLRDSMKHVPSETRRELVTRAVAWWKRHTQTDYGKKPTVRAGGEMQKSDPILAMPVDTLFKGGGWIKTKKGYKRRRGGKWEYYYPHPDGKPGKKVKKRKKKPKKNEAQLSLFGSTPKQEAPQQPSQPQPAPSRIARPSPDQVMTRATAALSTAHHKGDHTELRALARDVESLQAIQEYVQQNKNRPAKLAKVRKVLEALQALSGLGGIGRDDAAQAQARREVKREMRRVGASPKGKRTSAGIQGAPPGGWTEADRVPSSRPKPKQSGLESTGVPQTAAAAASGEAPKGPAGSIASKPMIETLSKLSASDKQEVLIDGESHRVEAVSDVGANLAIALRSKAGRRLHVLVDKESGAVRKQRSALGQPQPASIVFPQGSAVVGGPPKTGKLQSLPAERMIRKMGREWFVMHGAGGEGLPAMDSFKTKREATDMARTMVATWHAARGLPLPEGYEDKAKQYQAHYAANEARGFKDAPGKMPKIPDATSHIRLQAIGHVPAKEVSDLQPGDTLMWNYGATSTVQKVQKVSPKFVKITTLSDQGKEYTRRMKVDRLVGLDPSKHGFRKSHPALDILFDRPPKLVVFG